MVLFKFSKNYTTGDRGTLGKCSQDQPGLTRRLRIMTEEISGALVCPIISHTPVASQTDVIEILFTFKL